MTENKSNQSMDDEDAIMKNQMEKMVNSYDKYMKRITFGSEDALRTMTVNLAQIKQGDNVLEVGCATGTLTLAAKRQAGPTGKVFGIDILITIEVWSIFICIVMMTVIMTIHI